VTTSTSTLQCAAPTRFLRPQPVGHILKVAVEHVVSHRLTALHESRQRQVTP